MSAHKPKRKPTRAAQLGMTDEDYKQRFEQQNGVCAICGNPPKSRRLSFDHNHRTHRIRGLLCFRCNRALPTYATSQWLLDAYYYVRADEHPERSRTPLPGPDAELDQWAEAR
jgi:hypothetical protein